MKIRLSKRDLARIDACLTAVIETGTEPSRYVRGYIKTRERVRKRSTSERPTHVFDLVDATPNGLRYEDTDDGQGWC